MTSIEWTDKSWNPIVGCSIVSPGCTNCYAMKIASRLNRLAKDQPTHYFSTTKIVKGNPIWTGKIALAPDHILTAPLRWKKPRKIFVNSMGDLFHEDVPDEWIDMVFAVMALAPQHTFQVLTKRAKRMREYLGKSLGRIADSVMVLRRAHGIGAGIVTVLLPHIRPGRSWWPLPNVWLGVSTEDQTRADERIPDLLATTAAVRFVSAEPLIGAIDFFKIMARWQDAVPYSQRQHIGLGRQLINWIIVGGESGPGARPCNVAHVHSIVDQCRRAGVPVFVKQLGCNVRDRNDAGFEGCEPHEWPDIDTADVEHDLDGTRDEYQGASVRIRLCDRKGGDMAEWPENLRVRQFPEPAE